MGKAKSKRLEDLWGRLSSLAVLVAFATCGTAFGDPLTMPPAVAPNGKREIRITHFQSKITAETLPQISLGKPGRRKIISSAKLDIDESDSRKSVEAIWSP